MKTRPVFRLRLLGRFSLFREDASHPVRLSARKAGALLAYLAMAPNHSATREELATFLWGSCSDQQARQSLRQALLLLRKDVGQPDLVTSNAEIVSLQVEDWWVDALAFESLSKSGDTSDLATAARLLTGDFLEGLNLAEEGFDEWVSQQRQRLQRAAARLCERFAADPALVSDGEVALAAAERLHAFDPLREEWQRLVITLCARYRGNAEALAQAATFATLLKRELDVAPARETLRLVERIRDDETARLGQVSIAATVIEKPRVVAAETSQIEALALPVQSRPPWRSIPVLAAVAATALIAGAIFGALKFGTPPSPPQVAETTTAPATEAWRSPSPDKDASKAGSIIPLAVLPFAAIGDGSQSTQLLADMMTDDLINILSRVPTFRVISRQTTNRYKGQPIDIAAIGRDLRVGYIFEGSARVQDGIIRVNLQLYDPKTALPVWSGRVEREESDRYAVRDEIVARIARELQIDISSIEGERRADSSADTSAFLGWAAMQAAFTTINIEEYRKAEALFKQALQRDPQHASALIGLGSYHTNLGVQRLDGNPQAHFDRAYEILSQAVERNPKNPTALFQLGILLQGTRRIPEALKLFEKSVELSPSQAGAHAHIGHALARVGEPSKGVDHIRYAMRLSPRDPAQAIWHEFLGNAQLELSLYQEAAESFRHAAMLAPRYPRTWAGLASAYALAGDTANANAAVEKLKQLTDDPSANGLVKNFGRHPNSRLHAGLVLAVASSSDPWRSPDAGPSRRADRTAPPARSPESARDQSKTAGVVALAVIPFSLTGDSDRAAATTAEIITDDLTSALSRVSALRVISRQTAQSYRGARIDPVAVGTELGIRYLLQGSVAQHGDMLRLEAELLDAQTGRRIWFGRFERGEGDLRALQNDAINQLGRELSVEVTRAESSLGSDDLTTHELIFKGRAELFEAARLGVSALTRAEAFFTQALERSPDNVQAQSGLAAYHTLMAVQLFAPDPEPHLAKAGSILQPLLDKQPTTSEPYRSMGLLQIARGKGKDAAQWFERAIELNPSDAPSYAQLGRVLSTSGQSAAGLEQILYAVRLSPRDPSMAYWLAFAGTAELELEHDDKALAYFERALALHPTQPRTLLVFAAAQALSGNMDGARLTLSKAQSELPHLSGGKIVERFFGKATTTLPRLRRGLALLLDSTVASWQSPPPPSGTDANRAQSADIKGLAVLPFTTYGETDESVRPMAEAITSDLTDVLSRVPALRVISSQTMRTYTGQKFDVATVAAELGVRYVLEGNMRRHADKLRVNVELIDPSTRTTIWTLRVERDARDQYGVQDEIVGRLGRELHYEYYRVESERVSADSGVRQLLFKGWNAVINHAEFGLEKLEQARSAFDEVLTLEPGNGSARLGLGWYHVLVGSLMLDAERDAHLDEGEELLTDSLRRFPNNSGAHFMMGLLHRMRGRLPEGLASYQRATEINPSFASAYAHIGHTLVQMGRANEGVEQINYALRLSPRDAARSHWNRFAGEARIELGDVEGGIALLQKSYALNRRQPLTLRALASAYALSGQLEQARKFLAELRTVAPHISPGKPLVPSRPAPAQPELMRGLQMALSSNI